MLILRKYQLDIIFLFFALLILVWSAFFMLEYFGADPHNYEWYIVGPPLALYIAVLWKIRAKISLHERRAATAKSMFYWIALGVSLVASYESPIPAADYWSINVLFIVFTLLLADSYWDFKKLNLKSFRDKREIR